MTNKSDGVISNVRHYPSCQEVPKNETKKNDKVKKKYVRNLKTFDEENLEGNADEEPKKKKKEDTEVPKNETKKMIK